MQTNVSPGETLADIEISNSSRLSNRQDASSKVDQGIAGTAFAQSRNASGQMAFNRNQANLQNDKDRTRDATEQTSSLTKSGIQKSDNLLGIPSKSLGNQQPVPPAFIDWDSDLDLIGESNSYYYEPQGELLRVEQLEHEQSRDEFSIPHVVEGSGIKWNVEAPTADEDGFVVPQRPSAGLQVHASNKRKSPSEGAGASRQPDPKRSSRMMSDTSEGTSPPAEPATTSSNARPQAGPAGRLRSQTETNEARTRSSFPGVAGGRPGHGPAGLRRTLTDPSIPMVLPARKVFPIQIGDKLFRLSGASISSDGEYCGQMRSHEEEILTFEEPLHISPSSSKSNYGKMKVLTV